MRWNWPTPILQMWSMSVWLYGQWNSMLWHWWGDNLLLIDDANAFFIWFISDYSATWLSRAISASAAPTCRLDSVVKLARRATTATTPKGFTCRRLLITHSNANVATMLTNVAKASLDVVRIRTAWTPTDRTSAHVHGGFLETVQ